MTARAAAAASPPSVAKKNRRRAREGEDSKHEKSGSQCSFLLEGFSAPWRAQKLARGLDAERRDGDGGFVFSPVALPCPLPCLPCEQQVGKRERQDGGDPQNTKTHAVAGATVSAHRTPIHAFVSLCRGRGRERPLRKQVSCQHLFEFCKCTYTGL